MGASAVVRRTVGGLILLLAPPDHHLEGRAEGRLLRRCHRRGSARALDGVARFFSHGGQEGGGWIGPNRRLRQGSIGRRLDDGGREGGWGFA